MFVISSIFNCSGLFFIFELELLLLFKISLGNLLSVLKEIFFTSSNIFFFLFKNILLIFLKVSFLFILIFFILLLRVFIFNFF